MTCIKSTRFVLNIPEVCDYNSYISLITTLQQAIGLNVITPKLCVDSPNALPSDLLHPLLKKPSLLKGGVVHLHWPEKLTRQIGSSIFHSWLHQLKAEGVTIVRTLHNLVPHEHTFKDNIVEQILWDLTDVLHVFSVRQQETIRLLKNWWGKVIVAPHPNYDITIPSEDLATPCRIIAKNKLRRKLGLPHESVIFVMIGRIRAYKNFQFFLNVIKEFPNKQSQFLIAGNGDDMESIHLLLDSAQIEPRLKLNIGFLTEREYDQMLFAGDFALLPYFTPWSSGIAVRATNLRLPLIGYMPTMFDVPESVLSRCGVFLNEENSVAFGEALTRASLMPPSKVLDMGDEASRYLNAGTKDALLDAYKNMYEVI